VFVTLKAARGDAVSSHPHNVFLDEQFETLKKDAAERLLDHQAFDPSKNEAWMRYLVEGRLRAAMASAHAENSACLARLVPTIAPSRALAAARDYPALYEQVAQWALQPPVWTSLGWVGQLVAMLGEPHGGCAAPLLLELAERYPQAVYFPFQVSRAALEKRLHELGPAQAAA